MIRFGGIDNVTAEDDGQLRVAMHFDAPEVARAVLFGFTDQMDILEPETLRSPAKHDQAQ
jgi:hypothetical protein